MQTKSPTRAISKSEIFDLKSAPIVLRSPNFGVKNGALESEECNFKSLIT
jgi:hypothetical protein